MYLIRLSLEHASLPRSELNAILEGEGIQPRCLVQIGEYVVIDVDEEFLELLIKRMALYKEIGLLYALVNEEDVIKTVKDLNVCVSDVESVRGFGVKAKEIFGLLKDLGLICRHGFDDGVKIAFCEGIALIYRVLLKRRMMKYDVRNPDKRAVYMPGTMKPLLARAYVNLARVSSIRHEIVLDPFCGVGGFALEAADMGLRVICGDIDPRMAKGANTNIKFYGYEVLGDAIMIDAGRIGLRSFCVDGIATDPPYGRQSLPIGYDLPSLIKNFLEEASILVKPKRYIVFAIPLNIQLFVEKILDKLQMNLVEKHLDWVHGSLTRVLYVVRT